LKFEVDFPSYKDPFIRDFPASHVWLPKGSQYLRYPIISSFQLLRTSVPSYLVESW
jgi:hypothetical protein